MGRPFTFWCAAFALELDDGVDYVEWVPRASYVRRDAVAAERGTAIGEPV